MSPKKYSRLRYGQTPFTGVQYEGEAREALERYFPATPEPEPLPSSETIARIEKQAKALREWQEALRRGGASEPPPPGAKIPLSGQAGPQRSYGSYTPTTSTLRPSILKSRIPLGLVNKPPVSTSPTPPPAPIMVDEAYEEAERRAEALAASAGTPEALDKKYLELNRQLGVYREALRTYGYNRGDAISFKGLPPKAKALVEKIEGIESEIRDLRAMGFTGASGISSTIATEPGATPRNQYGSIIRVPRSTTPLNVPGATAANLNPNIVTRRIDPTKLPGVLARAEEIQAKTGRPWGTAGTIEGALQIQNQEIPRFGTTKEPNYPDIQMLARARALQTVVPPATLYSDPQFNSLYTPQRPLRLTKLVPKVDLEPKESSTMFDYLSETIEAREEYAATHGSPGFVMTDPATGKRIKGPMVPLNKIYNQEQLREWMNANFASTLRRESDPIITERQAEELIQAEPDRVFDPRVPAYYDERDIRKYMERARQETIEARKAGERGEEFQPLVTPVPPSVEKMWAYGDARVRAEQEALEKMGGGIARQKSGPVLTPQQAEMKQMWEDLRGTWGQDKQALATLQGRRIIKGVKIPASGLMALQRIKELGITPEKARQAYANQPPGLQEAFQKGKIGLAELITGMAGGEAPKPGGPTQEDWEWYAQQANDADLKDWMRQNPGFGAEKPKAPPPDRRWIEHAYAQLGGRAKVWGGIKVPGGSEEAVYDAVGGVIKNAYEAIGQAFKDTEKDVSDFIRSKKITGSDEAKKMMDSVAHLKNKAFSDVMVTLKDDIAQELGVPSDVAQSMLWEGNRLRKQRTIYGEGKFKRWFEDYYGVQPTPAQMAQARAGAAVGGPGGPFLGGGGRGGGGEPGGGGEGASLSWWMASSMAREWGGALRSWSRGATGLDLSVVQLMSGAGLLGYDADRSLALLRQTSYGQMAQASINEQLAQAELGKAYWKGPGGQIAQWKSEQMLRLARSPIAPWLGLGAEVLSSTLEPMVQAEFLSRMFGRGPLVFGRPSTTIVGRFIGGGAANLGAAIQASSLMAGAAGLTGGLVAGGLGTTLAALPVFAAANVKASADMRKAYPNMPSVKPEFAGEPYAELLEVGIKPPAETADYGEYEQFRQKFMQQVQKTGMAFPQGKEGETLARASYATVTQLGFNIRDPRQMDIVATMAARDVAAVSGGRPAGGSDTLARILWGTQMAPSMVSPEMKSEMQKRIIEMSQTTGIGEGELEQFSRWTEGALPLLVAGMVRRGEPVSPMDVLGGIEKMYQRGLRGRPGAQALTRAAMSTGNADLMSLAIADITGVPEIETLERDTFLPWGTTRRRELQTQETQLRRDYQAGQFGRQFAAAQRGYNWSKSQMAFGHMQSQTRAQWQIESIQASMAVAAQQKAIADEEFKINKQLFEMRHKSDLESLQLTRERIDIQRTWTKEDLAYQKNVRDMQVSWQLEDYDEGIRYATGRQKKQLRKQKERFLQLTSMEEGQRAKEEKRLGVQWSWEDKDVQRQQKQVQETYELERQLMELRKASSDLEYEAQMRNAAAQLEHIKTEMGWEDTQYQAQLKHLDEEYKAQIADIAAAQAYQVELNKIEDDLRKLNEDAQDRMATVLKLIVAAANEIAGILKKPGGGGGDEERWVVDPKDPRYEINTKTGERRLIKAGGHQKGSDYDPYNPPPSGVRDPKEGERPDRRKGESKYGEVSSGLGSGGVSNSGTSGININIKVDGSDYDARSLGRKLATVIRSELA